MGYLQKMETYPHPEHTIMNTKKLYIGLGVHKNSIAVATAEFGSCEAKTYGKWGGSNMAAENGLLKLRKKFGVDKSQIAICYEAGPTGFVLARRLLQLGYDCIVVAPTAVPQKSGDRVKTDKRDARNLARLLRAGELVGIHIPEPRDEAIRDLCRARTDASEALAKSKQQLGMFLLRNGHQYSGKAYWSQSHLNYLRSLTLPDPAHQIVLEEYIIAIDTGVERITNLEAHMKAELKDWDGESMLKH